MKYDSEHDKKLSDEIKIARAEVDKYLPLVLEPQKAGETSNPIDREKALKATEKFNKAVKAWRDYHNQCFGSDTE